MAAFPPHAVVAPWPGQGHINPFMELSCRLASHGFTITFVNVEFNHSRLLRSGSLPAALVDAGLDIRFESLPDGLPADHPRIDGYLRDLSRALIAMGPIFARLIQRLTQPPVTCIISDVFMLHTQDVANEYGIPRVAFWTQSASSYASHLMVAKGYRPPLDHSKNEGVITCIPGAPPLRLRDISNFLRLYDPSNILFDFVTRPFLRIDESILVVINSFDELEGPVLEALRNEHGHQRDVRTVGPLLPSEFFSRSLKPGMVSTALFPEDYSCLEWLKLQPPSSVLYVALGSSTFMSQQALEEIAFGLEASGLRFLWAIRPGFLEGELSAALSRGSFQERLKDRGRLVTWAPQLHVLSDGAVGGFLTHGGWNSILEGMAQGLPMLGDPFFADQMMNCRCIAEGWKNGLTLDPDESGIVTRVEVEGKVRALMEGRQIRERAQQLKDAARRTILEGSTTSNNLKFLVDAIIRMPTKSL